MNILRLITVLFVLFLFQPNRSNAQSKKIDNKALIQFSGVIIDIDSLQPIPFANVIIRTERRGTVADYYGFFSFVAMKGDTIDFINIGYKPVSYIIPDSLVENRYSIIQAMTRDTINLKEAVVYPWPSKEDFKRAFIELKVPDDDILRAQHNLMMAQRKDIQDNVSYDGSINFKFTEYQRQTSLYSAGQVYQQNIFNPLAWASFIKAWKDGAYKKKDTDSKN
jgi:hypothetical protein